MENINNLTNIHPIPRIGEPAPKFKAITTQGEINFPADYKGKWLFFLATLPILHLCVRLSLWPLASMQDEFKELNTELVGLSVDGLYSHIAWLRTIKEKIEFKGMKDVEVKFPLIEDISMEVANLYGMLQPGESNTKAVRAVFFIDPEGMIRTIIYYPLSSWPKFWWDKKSIDWIASGRCI